MFSTSYVYAKNLQTGSVCTSTNSFMHLCNAHIAQYPGSRSGGREVESGAKRGELGVERGWKKGGGGSGGEGQVNEV